MVERVQLHDRLEELVGVSGADILLDRPPGGWSDLVTNQSLDQRFAASEARLDRKLDALDHKIDTLEARVDRKLDALTTNMELRFAAIDAPVAAVGHRVGPVQPPLVAPGR